MGHSCRTETNEVFANFKPCCLNFSHSGEHRSNKYGYTNAIDEYENNYTQ